MREKREEKQYQKAESARDGIKELTIQIRFCRSLKIPSQEKTADVK
jgi:hypothetical protein